MQVPMERAQRNKRLDKGRACGERDAASFHSG